MNITLEMLAARKFASGDQALTFSACWQWQQLTLTITKVGHFYEGYVYIVSRENMKEVIEYWCKGQPQLCLKEQFYKIRAVRVNELSNRWKTVAHETWNSK